jgi:hypothetical protein
VYGVPVEVRPSSESWCRHSVNHRAITQNGKIKAVAVERHELGVSDLLAEGANQLLLAPLTHMRRAQSEYGPAAALAVSDECLFLHFPVAQYFSNIRFDRSALKLRMSKLVTVAAEATVTTRVLTAFATTFDAPKCRFEAHTKNVGIFDTSDESGAAWNRIIKNTIRDTSVESSDFAASMEARREMWLATSSSGSPSPFYCVIDGASKL